MKSLAWIPGETRAIGHGHHRRITRGSGHHRILGHANADLVVGPGDFRAKREHRIRFTTPRSAIGIITAISRARIRDRMTPQPRAAIRFIMKIALFANFRRSPHGRITSEYAGIREITRRAIGRATIVRNGIAAIGSRTFVRAFRCHARRDGIEFRLQIPRHHRAFGRARQNIRHAIRKARAVRSAIRHLFAAIRLQTSVAITGKNLLTTIRLFDVNRRAIQIELAIVGKIRASRGPKEQTEHRR